MRYKRFLLAALVCLLCSAVQVFSQESDWYYDKPISSITFRGLKNIKSRDLEGITNTFLGKKFSDEVFADLLNRLFALNYFEDINPIALPKDGKDGKDYSSVQVQIEVVEYPVVKKIRFTGNRKLHDGRLKENLGTRENSVYDENTRLADERRLQDFYITQGYTEATVSSSAEQDEDGFTVTFSIKEGQQTVIKTIEFAGNEVVASRTLRSKMMQKETGWLKGGKDLYQEALVEQDKKLILKYYQDHGYVDANIINVTITPEFNEKKQRRELTIQYNIHEGSRYTFGGVTIQGNKVFPTEELDDLIKLKAGNVYNETKFQEGLAAIQSLYYGNGYLTNQFMPQIRKDSDNKIVSYTLFIREGVRSHVENIVVKGNVRTKEELITREVPIQSGDIFSNTQVQNALRNLYNMQYFSQVVPDVQPGSEENLVDVVFSVQEQSTRNVQFGMTFSGVTDPGEFPISLFGSVQDLNLMGTGKSGSVSTSISSKEQSVTVSFGQDWTFGLPLSNDLSLGYTHSIKKTARNVFRADGSLNTTSYYMEFQQHRFTLSDSITRRWYPDFGVLYVGTGFSTSLITNIYDSKVYVPVYSTVSNYNGRWNPQNNIFASVALDARDKYYDPSEGWFLKQKFTWFGLIRKGALFFPENFGETEFFLRSETMAEKYFTLFDAPITEKWNLKMVLMGYSGLSMQWPFFNSAIRDASQLYIDGMFHGRGWEISDDEDIGRGNLVWNNTVELRIPIFPNAISFDLFFDASMVKDEPNQIKDFSNLDDWYFSYGPGLRVTMQQLPLRLLFVSNFKVEDDKIVWKDRDGDTLHSWLSTWHFVLSFNLTNR